jgi:Arc/MetJ-type ribon-helix-helix transcriptional regulator
MEYAVGSGRRTRGRPGRPAGGGAEEKPSVDSLAGWLTGRLPEGWFEGAPTLVVDRDEILIVGRVSPPDVPDGADEMTTAAAEAGRISRFREETREERMAVARQAEHRYGRSIAWGAEVGATTQVFTNASVPVMTRLRQPERVVLDTLVDSGVARSRSDALQWCVRLVASNTDTWLADLRAAMESVETVRQQGPSVA